MTKFQFGDKVRTKDDYYNLPKGSIGVVVATDGTSVLCLWDGYRNGHFSSSTYPGAWPEGKGGPFLYVFPALIELGGWPAPVTKPKSVAPLNPQAKSILKLLKTKGSITGVEAAAVYRVRALPRRISDLKEAGYKIGRTLSKDATGQRYARYYLIKDGAERIAS